MSEKLGESDRIDIKHRSSWCSPSACNLIILTASLDREKARRRKGTNEKKLESSQGTIVQDQTKNAKARKDLENVIFTPDNIVQQLSKHFQGQKLQFLSSQIKLANRKSKGKRYTEADRKIALALHLKSPQAYRLLCKVFSLPSTRSLARWKQVMKTNSGFSEEPFQLIRLMTKSMSSREKWFPGIR